MAGSSGRVLRARPPTRPGMISRGRLVRDVYENLRFRLRGSTDDRADDVRKRVGEMIAGVRVRDLERGLTRACSRGASAPVPADAGARLRPPGRGRAECTSSPPPRRRWPTCSPACSPSTAALARVLRSSTDATPAGPPGPFNYREGKVLSMRRGRRARRPSPEPPPTPYSDSESDLPMLRAVRYAVVVNPVCRAAADRSSRKAGR